MIVGVIYEVVIGIDATNPHDRWLIEAPSLQAAVKKANAKRRKQRELWKDFHVTSVRELGEVFR